MLEESAHKESEHEESGKIRKSEASKSEKSALEGSEKNSFEDDKEEDIVVVELPQNRKNGLYTESKSKKRRLELEDSEQAKEEPEKEKPPSIEVIEALKEKIDKFSPDPESRIKHSHNSPTTEGGVNKDLDRTTLDEKLAKIIYQEELVELMVTPEPSTQEPEKSDNQEFGSEYHHFMKWKQLKLAKLKALVS